MFSVTLVKFISWYLLTWFSSFLKRLVQMMWSTDCGLQAKYGPPPGFVHIWMWHSSLWNADGCFLRQRQSWVVVKKTIRFTSLKYLRFGPLLKRLLIPGLDYTVSFLQLKTFSIKKEKLKAQLLPSFQSFCFSFYLRFQQSISVSFVGPLCKFHTKHQKQHFSSS